MTQKIIFIALLFSTLLFSCKKKKEDTTPTVPLTPTLTFEGEIGNAGTSLNEFNFGFGEWRLASDNEFVYVADEDNHCVKKVDLSSKSVIGWYGYSNGIWGYYDGSKKADVFFKPDQVIYKNNILYILRDKYTSDIGYQTQFYKINSNTNKLIDSLIIIKDIQSSWSSIDIDNQENIYVFGANSDSIKKYSNNQFVLGFGGFGSTEGKFDHGGNIIVDGDIITSFDNYYRVQLFNTNGTYLSKITTPVNQFLNLQLLNGNYFVNCYFNDTDDKSKYMLVKFDKNGSIIQKWIIGDHEYFWGYKMVFVKNKVIYNGNNKLYVYSTTDNF